MQRFERSREPPPPVFRSPEADRNRKMLRDYLGTEVRKRAQTSVPKAMLSLEDSSVTEALARLFHGKCAFCEEQTETQPYRFRPTGEARPFVQSEVGHLYYTWLTDAWENIYPICRNCRPAEPDYFPVLGKRAPLPTDQQLDRYIDEAVGLWRDYPPQEKPLLLDPCGRGEFYRDFHVELSGKLIPRSEAAAETARHFSLNHPERLQHRRDTYHERLRSLIDYLSNARVGGGQITQLFNFNTLEFGGTWFLLLRRLLMAMRNPGRAIPIASKNAIADHFLRLYGRPDAAEGLRVALSKLSQEDAAGVTTAVPPRPRASRARLTAVRITDYKSLEQIELVLPEPRTSDESKTIISAPSVLILGENASGKSSILEAVALALADPEARAALDLRTDQLSLEPSFLGAAPGSAHRRAQITISLDGMWTRTLVIEGNDYNEQVHLDVPIPPVFAYGAFRHYVDGARPHRAGKYIRSLFGKDPILSNPDRWLFGLEDSQFDMVVRALREILSVEGEFEVIRRDQQQRRCLIITRIAGQGGSYVDMQTPLSIASSGFRSVLAMVCDVFQGLMDKRVHANFETLSSARAVVLIDEVEAHLHPRWKMQIMRGLRAALPNVTFIATTHDPLCLRGMDDGEVRVVQKVSGDQVHGTHLPVFVEQLREPPTVSQLTVEQLLTSDLFQLYSTDTPETDAQLASVADLLARQRAGAVLEDSERETLERFDEDIASALPVGSSEVHRLVQDAVAAYLRERRTASDEHMRRLRELAKDKIISALRGI